MKTHFLIDIHANVMIFKGLFNSNVGTLD